MLAEELVVIDGDSQLWRAARPLLDIALRLEQNGDTSSWHGWSKGRDPHISRKVCPHYVAWSWEYGKPCQGQRKVLSKRMRS